MSLCGSKTRSNLCPQVQTSLPDCHRKSQRRTKIVSPFLLSILRMHHRVVQSNLFDCTTQGGFRQIELDRTAPSLTENPPNLTSVFCACQT